MKILIEGGDLNSPFVEGTRNIAKTYWEELKRRGHEIIILTRKKETNTEKEFPAYEIQDKIKYYRWGNYFELFSILVKIRGENINYIHIFAKALRPTIYLSLLKKILRKPIVFSLLGYPFNNGYKQKSLPKFLKKIKILLVSSKTIFNELKRQSPSKKISYLPYGIDTKKFIPNNKEKKEINIVCLKKPTKETILAFNKLCKERTDLHLILDKKLSKEEGVNNIPNKKIKYISFLPDISKLLNDSDILIELHPKVEFLDCASPPLLLLESMASGMGVISSNIPEINEVVKTNSEGLLIECNKKESIYLAIKKIIKKRKKYGQNARKKILEKFDIRKICRLYEQIAYFDSNPKL